MTNIDKQIAALQAAAKHRHAGTDAFVGDCDSCRAQIAAEAELTAIAVPLAESWLAMRKALEHVHSLPLLMRSWEKSSRDAAYDEIAAALDAEGLREALQGG